MTDEILMYIMMSNTCLHLCDVTRAYSGATSNMLPESGVITMRSDSMINAPVVAVICNVVDMLSEPDMVLVMALMAGLGFIVEREYAVELSADMWVLVIIDAAFDTCDDSDIHLAAVIAASGCTPLSPLREAILCRCAAFIC